MENMQIKNLLLVVLFMSAQLFGSDRVEDLFGVDRAAINKGLVTVSALGVLAYIANSIRQVNQSRIFVKKEIVRSGAGTGVLANRAAMLNGQSGVEEILDKNLKFKDGKRDGKGTGEKAVRKEDEKSDEEEAVVVLSPNILENLLCEVMCEIVDNNLNVNFGSSESLEARYNVMRERYYPNQRKDFSAWSCEMLEKITDINTGWNRDMESIGCERQRRSLENLTQLQKNSILGCLLYNRWRKPVGLRQVRRAVDCVKEGAECSCQPVDQSTILFSDFDDDRRIKETRLSKIKLCREYVQGVHVGCMLPITPADQAFYDCYFYKKEVANILKPLEKLDPSREFGDDQLKYVIVSVSRIPGLTMGDFAKTVEDYCAEYRAKQIGSAEDDQDSV